MSSVYFEEKQRSAEIAICIIIAALVQLLFLWGLIQQLQMKISALESPLFISGKGWTYTMSGDYGIQLVMTTGKKVVIGTHKAEEVSRVINDLKNKGIISNVSE